MSAILPGESNLPERQGRFEAGLQKIREKKVVVDIHFNEVKDVIKARSRVAFETLAESESLAHAKGRLAFLLQRIKLKKSKIAARVREIDAHGYTRLNNITRAINQSIVEPSTIFVINAIERVNEFLKSLNPVFRNNEDLSGSIEGVAVDKFIDAEGNEKAREVAVRIETVPLLSKGMKIAGSALNVEDEANGSTWGSTNTPRNSKDKVLPILCNLRTQQVINDQGEILSTINRSAAMSDFSHGEVSLQELIDYEDLNKLGLGEEIPEQRKLTLAHFYSFNPHHHEEAAKVAEKIKINSLLAYGADVLLPEPVDQQLREAIQQMKTANQPLSKVIELLKHVTLDINKLGLVSKGRADYLKWVAIQDLYAHFQTKNATSESTLYTRVSLLEIPKRPLKSNGVVLSEHTQGLDMKALFDLLDGETIVFDLDEEGGPYFDEAGIIHMPKAFSEVESTTLRTVLFNVSVRGMTDNTHAQELINTEALVKLQAFSQDAEHNRHLQKLIERLSHEVQYDPYETACEAVLTLQAAGAYVGLNCYGGKDRTGYVSAMVTHHHLKAVLSHGSPTRSKTLKRWGRHLVSKRGVAAKIAFENTGYRIIKIGKFTLKLYNTSSIAGKMQRTAALIETISVGLKAKARGGYNLSNARGQLYDTRDFPKD